MCIRDSFEKAANHRCRDHICDPLRDVSTVALEGDADHFAALHNGATAVTWVDLGADLNREVRIDRRVGVKVEVDPRNDTGGDRHALATNWVAVSRDG